METIGYNELQNTLIEAEQLRNIPNFNSKLPSKIKIKQISGIQSLINKEEKNSKEDQINEISIQIATIDEIVDQSKTNTLKKEKFEIQEDVIKESVLKKQSNNNKQKITMNQNPPLIEKKSINNMISDKFTLERKNKIEKKAVYKQEKSSFSNLNIKNSEVKELLNLLDINEFDDDFEVDSLKREILSIIVQISNLE